MSEPSEPPVKRRRAEKTVVVYTRVPKSVHAEMLRCQAQTGATVAAQASIYIAAGVRRRKGIIQ